MVSPIRISVKKYEIGDFCGCWVLGWGGVGLGPIRIFDHRRSKGEVHTSYLNGLPALYVLTQIQAGNLE